MGNNNTREARGPESSSANARQTDSAGVSGPASPADRPAPVYSSRTGRGSRPDLSFLGIGTSSQNEVPERRETKQEREARKLEKERVARVKERERSLKEEHVDGGYLVTMGVYTGPEDFNKAIVRQLMIERRMAPFWRGLDDFKEEWTEHQLVAAGRGLPIPAADEIPSDDLTRPLSPESANPSNHNLNNLMPPISSRSHSTASDASATLSPSHPAFSNASSPSSPSPAPAHSSSPFRPRSKTLASLTSASKNTPSSEIVPREIQLPKDPYVNGQAIEVYLYKDSAECPICFMYYPPYLNKTRCCDQPICSECFVQIKRPDPHPPEHHDPSNPAPPPTEANVDSEALVSEPACCPYCQQPEFGVTYEHPPFRRGLAYANANQIVGNVSSAMSSSTSINSTGASPTLSPSAQRRRTISLSANASTVITTDKVRPDWSTKLQSARNHLARRSAAATALHTAAYLIGNGATVDQRSFGFSGRNRFGRSHRGENSPGTSGAATPSPTTNEPTPRSVSDQLHLMRREAQESGGARNRSRMEDLEEMMMMEAIRQSLAAEEERKKKMEKEAAKEAKKKAKEDKKKEKKERRVYGSGASSASGSALSLSLPSLSIGRRRGNSGASNLQREVTLEDHEVPESKGKGVDRSPPSAPSASSSSAPIDFPGSASGYGIPGARHLDTSTLAAINDSHQSSASPTAPDRPSHLRQMSNASSPASSFVESVPGSLRNEFNTHGSSSTIDSPNASGVNLTAGNTSTDGGDAGPDSLFNFQSLATMISQDSKEDKEDAARHIEHLDGETSRQNINAQNSAGTLEESVATLKVNGSADTNGDTISPAQLEQERTTPEVMITPETPAARDHGDDDGKQLGWSADSTAREITQ
ncbi:SNF1-interacting protein [Cadophora gregata]|uniref:SNF1-interacting protein n=1 Tax=Cadophora gregata TaxID=51156 RepID=UPI0026DBB64D|nr:SNF1-interacting protein [Cadophora gregata]KAK0104574.1 SNF1-interacting protein [Cadophora gregata]KAK0115337.1 SNF1-interacting protein [Cadophora gregata f. sp. sojae]